MNFETERTEAIRKEKVATRDKTFLNDSLNKKMEIIGVMHGCAKNIAACVDRYRVKLTGDFS